MSRWIVYLTDEETLMVEYKAGGTGTTLGCQPALKTREGELSSIFCSGAVLSMTVRVGTRYLEFLDVLEVFPVSLFLLFRDSPFLQKPYCSTP